MLITTLNLSLNGLDAEAGKALASALEVNAVLTNINLLRNNIGTEGGKVLAKALKINAVLKKKHRPEKQQS